jgi:hypothetical protein
MSNERVRMKTIVKRVGATGLGDFPIGGVADIPGDAPVPDGWEVISEGLLNVGDQISYEGDTPPAGWERVETGSAAWPARDVHVHGIGMQATIAHPDGTHSHSTCDLCIAPHPFTAVDSRCEKHSLPRWHEIATEGLPPDDTWCWVTSGNGSVFIAKADALSAGGWANEDTWEDFDHEVVAWLPIQPPPAPPTKD